MDAGALDRLCADFDTEVTSTLRELLERHAAELRQRIRWLPGVPPHASDQASERRQAASARTSGHAIRPRRGSGSRRMTCCGLRPALDACGHRQQRRIDLEPRAIRRDQRDLEANVATGSTKLMMPPASRPRCVVRDDENRPLRRPRRAARACARSVPGRHTGCVRRRAPAMRATRRTSHGASVHFHAAAAARRAARRHPRRPPPR